RRGRCGCSRTARSCCTSSRWRGRWCGRTSASTCRTATAAASRPGEGARVEEGGWRPHARGSEDSTPGSIRGRTSIRRGSRGCLRLEPGVESSEPRAYRRNPGRAKRAKEGAAVGSLFAGRTFSDFGPDHLHPAPQPPPVHLLEGPGNALLRSRVREHGPKHPGVYGMVDRHGDLIYVGKAKCLRTRLLSYFRPRSRDPKAGRILEHTSAIACEVCPSEFAALHRELEL